MNPDALPDGVTDRRQDLGQVAADLVLDVDRRHQEVKILELTQRHIPVELLSQDGPLV